MGNTPYLGPCRDSSEGYKDRAKYEQLQLPSAWTDDCIGSPGTWIAPDEYFWTPDSFFEAKRDMTPELLREIREKTSGCFYYLPLVEQCSLLGIRYEKLHPADMAKQCVSMPLQRSDSVEKFALDFFVNQGWVGERGEGTSFHLILHVLRRRLEAQGIMFHNYYYSELHPMVHPHRIFKRIAIELTESKAISEKVQSVLAPERLSSIHTQWIKTPQIYPFPKMVKPEMFTLNQLLDVCEGISPTLLASMTELAVLGYMGAGWPDLTLQKNKEIRFVEVKQTTDKFTHRQAYWIRNFAIPLALDASVVHVSPSLKKGFPT